MKPKCGRGKDLGILLVQSLVSEPAISMTKNKDISMVPRSHLIIWFKTQGVQRPKSIILVLF
jgi:hypothetical protein